MRKRLFYTTAHCLHAYIFFFISISLVFLFVISCEGQLYNKEYDDGCEIFSTICPLSVNTRIYGDSLEWTFLYVVNKAQCCAVIVWIGLKSHVCELLCVADRRKAT